MAKAVEARWDGNIDGLVVTRYQHGLPCRSIEVVEARIRFLTKQGQQAARRILEKVKASPPTIWCCA